MTTSDTPRRGSREGIDALQAQIDDALSGYETQRAADHASASVYVDETNDWSDDRTDYTDQPGVIVELDSRITHMAELAASLPIGAGYVNPTLRGDPVTLAWSMVEGPDGEVVIASSTITDASGSITSRTQDQITFEVTHVFDGDIPDDLLDAADSSARALAHQAVITLEPKETDESRPDDHRGHWHVVEVAEARSELVHGVTIINGVATVDRCKPSGNLLARLRQALIEWAEASEVSPGTQVHLIEIPRPERELVEASDAS